MKLYWKLVDAFTGVHDFAWPLARLALEAQRRGAAAALSEPRLRLVVCLIVAATVACGSREVTKPEAVSAKLIGGVMLGRDSTEMVAITVYVPPTSTFRLSDFTVGSSVCCVGLKIGGQSVEANRVEQFSTEAKTVKVELVFLQAPGVKEVTLSYNNAPAGAALKVSR